MFGVCSLCYEVPNSYVCKKKKNRTVSYLDLYLVLPMFRAREVCKRKSFENQNSLLFENPKLRSDMNFVIFSTPIIFLLIVFGPDVFGPTGHTVLV